MAVKPRRRLRTVKRLAVITTRAVTVVRVRESATAIVVASVIDMAATGIGIGIARAAASPATRTATSGLLATGQTAHSGPTARARASRARIAMTVRVSSARAIPIAIVSRRARPWQQHRWITSTLTRSTTSTATSRTI